MSLLRKAAIAIFGLTAFGSALICLWLWVQIDGDLTTSFFKVRQAGTQEQIYQALEGIDGSINRLYGNWSKLPGVHTKVLYDLTMLVRSSRARLSLGEPVSQVRGDILAEYGSTELMPWFPYGHTLWVSIALLIAVLLMPEIHFRNRLRRAWYKRHKTHQIPRDFAHLVK